MKHIVIIGGGYGGVAALRRLANTEDIRVTLIDQHPYHFLQTEGYELVAGTMPFDKTLVNLQTLCNSYGEHISFLHALVTTIDFNSKCLYFRSNQEIFYDYLIIAAGSMTGFFKSIEGL
jgi:NADH dehydrogenase